MQLKCNINSYGINCTVLYCIIMHKKQKQTANVKKKRFTFPRAVGIVVIPYPSILKSSDHTNQIHVVGLFQRFPSSLKAQNFGKNLVKERHWQYCGPEVRQTYFPELNWTSGSGSTLWIRISKTEQKFALKIDFAHL